MNRVGSCYMRGIGTEENHITARDWFLKAAEQGHPLACLNLGRLYHLGEGINRDYEEAYKWFSKAAQHENPFAWFYLGEMYLSGEYVQNNIEKAIEHFKKAAAKIYWRWSDKSESAKYESADFTLDGNDVKVNGEFLGSRKEVFYMLKILQEILRMPDRKVSIHVSHYK